MYKLLPINQLTNEPVNGVKRLADNAFIPFDPDNTDYANFKKEVLAGAELQSAEGQAMSQEQANQFVGGLA
jgi:hypothetical protein